jgi:hypothetical protein
MSLKVEERRRQGKHVSNGRNKSPSSSSSVIAVASSSSSSSSAAASRLTAALVTKSRYRVLLEHYRKLVRRGICHDIDFGHSMSSTIVVINRFLHSHQCASNGTRRTMKPRTTDRPRPKNHTRKTTVMNPHVDNNINNNNNKNSNNTTSSNNNNNDSDDDDERRDQRLATLAINRLAAAEQLERKREYDDDQRAWKRAIYYQRRYSHLIRTSCTAKAIIKQTMDPRQVVVSPDSHQQQQHQQQHQQETIEMLPSHVPFLLRPIIFEAFDLLDENHLECNIQANSYKDHVQEIRSSNFTTETTTTTALLYHDPPTPCCRSFDIYDFFARADHPNGGGGGGGCHLLPLLSTSDYVDDHVWQQWNSSANFSSSTRSTSTSTTTTATSRAGRCRRRHRHRQAVLANKEEYTIVEMMKLKHSLEHMIQSQSGTKRKMK